MGALHEDILTFLIVSQGILLRRGNVSDKTCREKQNNFMFNNFFWDNVEKYGTAKTCHWWQYNTAHALHMLEN